MQATAYTFDEASHSGSVLLDDGTPVEFDGAAFDAGGLRLLRPGQRVRIEFAEPGAEAATDAATRASAEATAAPAADATSADPETPSEGPHAADATAPQAPQNSSGTRQIALVTLHTW